MFCLVDFAIGLGNATGITYTDIEDVMVHNVHSDVTKDGLYSSGETNGECGGWLS